MLPIGGRKASRYWKERNKKTPPAFGMKNGRGCTEKRRIYKMLYTLLMVAEIPLAVVAAEIVGGKVGTGEKI